MPDPKISLITVTFNAGKTLGACIGSVITQTYGNVEYIVVDGGSTDDTLQIVSQYKRHIAQFVSEPDKGIYDAMNKGIRMATGDIIGMLNADDHFAADDILATVAQAFTKNATDIIYGDLDYTQHTGKVVRKWRSGRYTDGQFNWGWMPPHPTFYCKRPLFDTLGMYDTQYGTAADYELMLRFIHLHKCSVTYVNKLMVNMVIGGASNQNFNNRLKAWGNDLSAMRKNGVFFPLLCVIIKPLRKVLQYI